MSKLRMGLCTAAQRGCELESGHGPESKGPFATENMWGCGLGVTKNNLICSLKEFEL